MPATTAKSRSTTRKPQSSNHTCYPSPVLSDAADDTYHHFIRDTQSPYSSDQDSANSVHSTWDAPSRDASCCYHRSVSPQAVSQAAAAGLGIRYPDTAFYHSPDMCMFDQAFTPTTVSPQMLEQPMPPTAPSSVFLSNASICSSMFETSDAISLDEYDLIHTPEPLSHDDSARIADERTWFTSPGGPYEPANMHVEQEGHFCQQPSEPLLEVAAYNLRRAVKQEDEQSERMKYYPEGDSESSSGSSSGSGSEDEDEDEDDEMEDVDGGLPCRRHLANEPYANPKYTCKLCGKGFMRTFNYNSHLATHNPYRERPFKCAWAECGKNFFRSTDLKRHQNSVHVKSEDFKCGTCGAGFPRKDSLQRHRKDGCAHRAGTVSKRPPVPSASRRASKSSDSAYAPTISRGHIRRSSRTAIAKSEYMSREEALAIARSDGANLFNYEPAACKTEPGSGPYFVDGHGCREGYGTPDSQ